MHRVIVNADDFGITEGVTEGIVEAIKFGAVTNTTAMVCVEGAVERLRNWGPLVRGRVGAHLQLTTGRPLTPRSLTPSLADASGWFHGSKHMAAESPVEEIVLEWEAQLAAIRDAGIEADHIDSHHHVHKFPNPFLAFCELALRHNLPARATGVSMANRLRQSGIACPDVILLDYYGADLSEGRLLSLLADATAGAAVPWTVEVMCHPGNSCPSLARLSNYVEDRDRELATLRRPALKSALAVRGFALAAYGGLAAVARSV